MTVEDLRSGHGTMFSWKVVVVEEVASLAKKVLAASRGVVVLAQGGCAHKRMQGEEVVHRACGSGSIEELRGEGVGEGMGPWCVGKLL